MAGQNSTHGDRWVSGPSSRANRMDRKHNRSTRNMTVTGKGLEALARGDRLGFAEAERLREWAARHNAK